MRLLSFGVRNISQRDLNIIHGNLAPEGLSVTKTDLQATPTIFCFSNRDMMYDSITPFPFCDFLRIHYSPDVHKRNVVVVLVDQVDVEAWILVRDALNVCLSRGVVARDEKRKYYLKSAAGFQCHISNYFVGAIAF